MGSLALKAMFLSRNDEDVGFSKLQAAYQDSLTEVHVSFYTSALTMCTRYNKFLQRSNPLAHKIYPKTESLIIFFNLYLSNLIQQAHVPITSVLGDEAISHSPKYSLALLQSPHGINSGMMVI